MPRLEVVIEAAPAAELADEATLADFGQLARVYDLLIGLASRQQGGELGGEGVARVEDEQVLA